MQKTARKKDLLEEHVRLEGAEAAGAAEGTGERAASKGNWVYRKPSLKLSEAAAQPIGVHRG